MVGIEKLSDFVIQLKYEKTPKKIVQSVKNAVLDLLGNALAGSTTTESKFVNSAIADLDRTPDATIWAVGNRVSTIWATVANAVAQEGFDFTEGPKQACIIPAITIGEKEKLDGRTIIESAVAGAEVVQRVIRSIDAKTTKFHGFYPSGLVNSLGAAATVGKILGLDSAQLTSAFGIAGTLAGGLFGWIEEGLRLKALLIGKGLFNGMLASYTSQRGLIGPNKVFTSKFGGFLKSYSGPNYDAARLTHNMPPIKWCASEWTFKPYPCCRYNHPYIDCLFRLFEQREITLEDVSKITAYGTMFYKIHIFEPEYLKTTPRDVATAQFSLPYILAATIKDRSLTLDQFSEEKLRDPEILRAAKKVEFVVDPDIEKEFHYGPPSWKIPARLTIKTCDGGKYSVKVDSPKGLPNQPMTYEDIVEKFRMQAGRVLLKERVERIISVVQKLERLHDINDLVRLLY